MLKKILEAIINIILWLASTYIIVRTFSLETEAVEKYSIGGIKSVTKIYNYKLQYSLMVTTFFKLAFFYLNIFFFSGFLFNRKYVKHFILLLSTILVFLVIERFIINTACDRFCFDQYYQIGLGLYAFYYLTSLIYAFLIEYRKDQKLKKDLLHEKTDAELKLLRSQINPHFLFNTLNNLLSIAEKEDQKDVSNGIFQLSELLRYMLYDTSNNKVVLEKEIEFIESYIKLNKLRFDDEDAIEISFSKEGIEGHELIAPAILISFVENAFKHGIDIYNKSYIDMKLTVYDGVLNFNICNSLHSDKDVHELEGNGSGIGLQNVKKRLRILYPEKHKLKIEEKEKDFCVTFELIL
ncbi:MAG: sensor histidine kinase [Flavobacteriaceae bacterium]|nr:sensor histidine kinase [Flavobacteriaceae bacterium]